jgi:gentisate 1,2-dioxygenase
VQETASSVYHVVEGSGHSTISGKKYAWKRGDTFCIPSWHAYEHCADNGTSPVYLYRFDDKPMLLSLGFYRSADMDVESLVSE